MTPEKQLKLQRYIDILDDKLITYKSLNILVDNFIEVINAKKIESIDCMTVSQWTNWFKSRIGREPILRLLFLFFRSLSQSEVQFHEIMTEDPTYYVECLTTNNYLAYYYEYHPQFKTDSNSGPIGVESMFESDIKGCNGATGASL